LAIGSEIYCKGEQTKIKEAEDQEIEQPKLNKGDDHMREVNQEVSGGRKSETGEGKEKKKKRKRKLIKVGEDVSCLDRSFTNN